MSVNLERLVAALPEVYQPIFGHPELSAHVSRRSDDRLTALLTICHDLSATLQRPVRILDLGCAQGFFTLGLAQAGARVHGIDFDPRNVAVCDALARQSPGWQATFEVADIETVIAAIQPGAFDLVLGLSVFHHIVHRVGALAVQRMLTSLAAKVAVGVFEMAQATEPPAWAASLPDNPRAVLAGFGFVVEIERYATHLSSIERPLYFASSRYWRLQGRMEPFERWTSQSHLYEDGTNLGTRRYFFSRDHFVKLLQLDCPRCGAHNKADNANETTFLTAPPDGFEAPALIAAGHSACEAWIVREHVPGRLLVDLIHDGSHYDPVSVLDDVLAQLVALEAAGLYHNDLRTWNVLIRSDGRARLIDYGAITSNRHDCALPSNIFVAFWIFAHEVLSRRVDDAPIRLPVLSPTSVAAPYRHGLLALLGAPETGWRFETIQEHVQAAKLRDEARSEPFPGFALALTSLEDSCRQYRLLWSGWRNRALEMEVALTRRSA